MRRILDMCFILLLFVFQGCDSYSTEEWSPERITRYIANSDNGLHDIKEFPHLQISAKYIPPKLLNTNSTSFPFEKDRLVFLLRLNPTTAEAPLFYTGVSSYEEFKERNERLFFDLENNFYFKVKDERVFPSHALVEHNYGITKDIAFYIQFVHNLETLKEEELELYYLDTFFNMGQMKFKFSVDEIQKFNS